MCPLGISMQEVLPEGLFRSAKCALRLWPGRVGLVCLLPSSGRLGMCPQALGGSCLRTSLQGQQRAFVPAESV